MVKVRSTDKDDDNNYKNRKVNGDLWYRIGYALLIGAMILCVYRTRFEAIAEQVKANTEKIMATEKDTIVLKTEFPKIQEDLKEVKGDIKIIQSDIISIAEFKEKWKLTLRKNINICSSVFIKMASG